MKVVMSYQAGMVAWPFWIHHVRRKLAPGIRVGGKGRGIGVCVYVCRYVCSYHCDWDRRRVGEYKFDVVEDAAGAPVLC